MAWITSGNVVDLIKTLIKKKSQKVLFNYGQDIVMAFSPLLQVVIVKKGLQKGGSRAPQDASLATPTQLTCFKSRSWNPLLVKNYGRIYVWATMHLSLLSHRVGGGGVGRPREIWHFHKSQSQIPHPWALRKSQIPSPGYRFLNRS